METLTPEQQTFQQKLVEQMKDAIQHRPEETLLYPVEVDLLVAIFDEFLALKMEWLRQYHTEEMAQSYKKDLDPFIYTVISKLTAQCYIAHPEQFREMTQHHEDMNPTPKEEDPS